MPVTLLNGPAAVITVADAKAHLRVETADDDALIGTYVAAAQGSIDGPPGWLGRAIGTQTLQASGLDWMVDGLRLPYGVVQSVESITLGGIAVPAESYALGADGLLRGTGWPWWTPGGPVITYVAGYAADKVPAPIKAALLLMVADLYSVRDGKVAVTLVDNPTIGRLLAPYRLWSL